MFKLSDYRKSQILQWVARLLKYKPPVQIHEVEREVQELKAERELDAKQWMKYSDLILKGMAAGIGEEILKHHLFYVKAFKSTDCDVSAMDKYIVQMKVDVLPPLKK